MHRRLQVNRRLVRVDAHREVVQHHLADVGAHLLDVFVRGARGQRVQVGNQEVALVLVLQLDTILQ
jgi:hypothetical protein